MKTPVVSDPVLLSVKPNLTVTGNRNLKFISVGKELTSEIADWFKHQLYFLVTIQLVGLSSRVSFPFRPCLLNFHTRSNFSCFLPPYGTSNRVVTRQ